jgi:VRR-NUC domain/Fanconi anemia-associated nuclease SAP domain
VTLLAVLLQPSTRSAYYYLANFERALAWIAQRYDDVLTADEHVFVNAFPALPLSSRALLVRMLMRKGPLFRASKLAYDEIGCPLQAAAPLQALRWVDLDPLLSIDALFAIATKPQLLQIFPALRSGAAGRKTDWFDAVRDAHGGARTLAQWDPKTSDRVLLVNITDLCDRLRLMFFGNLHQDWSEFVLADLGIFQYERVEFAPSSRAFQRREDIDAYLSLHACREALDGLDDGEPVDSLMAQLDAIDCTNAWLATRRARILFRIGQHCERREDWDAALSAYSRSAWPGSRHRRMRVLERCARFSDALRLALEAINAPVSEEEHQRIIRMLPRLQRRLGQSVSRVAHVSPIPRSTLTLARPNEPHTVESAVRDHLTQPDAPVHYVENTLINSLFGLLCWEPIFAAVPGAFFHPFQRGPADLHAPDFRSRRAEQFTACLAQLDDTRYRATILHHFATKADVQSPFVVWGALSGELLEQALSCLPPAHLRLWFERLLQDIRGNRSGLPDLVRFWPAIERYELIEVKGPGDHLQDNQIRWLAYCVQHRMPVRVVDAQWSDEPLEHGLARDGETA